MKYWRSILLWGGLLLALAVANQGVVQRERILSDGRVLLMALEPVDPRSMMQGDYMALRFAAVQEIRDALDPACARARNSNTAAAMRCLGFDGKSRTGSDGYAVFALDPDGVGRFVRIQPAPRPVATGEIAVRFRGRGWDMRIASNAWFFPEGQGERYAPAKYGELRVDADGTALLAGMRGEDRKPL